MTKYDNYKDSGIDWLGEVPSHWEVKALGEVCGFQNGYAFKSELYKDTGLPIIRITNIQNNTINTSKMVYFDISEISDKLDQFIARKNDILIAMSGATTGKIALCSSDEDFYLNQRVGKFIPQETLLTFFLFCYLSIKMTEISMIATGTAQPNLNTTQIKDLLIPLPPLEEQEIIANYLDKQTQKIDTLINDKQNLISLLKEQRSAIISETVTKGLNPSVTFKDSGIEWLGTIPSHWDVKKIKYVAEIIMGSSPNSENYTEDINYTIFIQGNADIEDRKIKPRIYTKQITKLCKINDILLSVRAPVGSVIIANYPACIGRGLCAIRGNKYIYYQFEQLNINKIWRKLSYGTTFEAVNTYDIQNIYAILPPLEEQEIIAHYLDTQTQKIDTLITDVQTNIEQLKEYRQSLISEVVTGKKKVTHGS